MSSYYNYGGPMGNQTRFNQNKASPIRSAAGNRAGSGYSYQQPMAAQQMRTGSNPAFQGVGTTQLSNQKARTNTATVRKNQSYGTNIEIIENRLYFVSGPRPPTSYVDAYFFSVDQELVYDAFNNDFGPLNLAMVHKFVRELVRLLADPQYKDYRLFHYCSNKYDKMANGAFLMGAFMIIVLKVKAEAAWELFEPYHDQFQPFRDASYALQCSYPCTILHCLQGLEYAIRLGWYKFREFDNKEYEYYEKVENGDLNWIIPDKFIAFMGPLDNISKFERRGNTPEDYLQVFKHFNVTRVIRLNEAKYDKNKFIRNGIEHSDLYFIDGSTPPDSIVKDFLDVAEKENGVMAIHCKAGLGRTGTLIGLYAMKHFKFPAAAFIGWIRIARPGSILGPQQHYLIEKEAEYLGEYAYMNQGSTKMNLEMSPEDKRRSLYGEYNQGDGLVDKKLTSPKRNSKKKGMQQYY